MIKKFILLLVLLSCGANATTSKVLRELITAGMRTLEGKKVISKFVSESSEKYRALVQTMEGPIAEESAVGGLIEKELLYELAKDAKSDQLEGIDLSEGNFENIDLSRANLVRVNFAGADLSGAILSKAKLDRASFAGANLSGAKILGVDLSQVNLDGAKYDSTTKLPLFFNPIARKMIYTSTRGEGINWKEEYWLGEDRGISMVFACLAGAPIGASAAFVHKMSFLDEESDFYGQVLGGAALVGIAAIPLGFNRSNINQEFRVGIHRAAMYACGTISGTVTGNILTPPKF